MQQRLNPVLKHAPLTMSSPNQQVAALLYEYSPRFVIKPIVLSG